MQYEPEQLPIVLWPIPCFDRNRANPLPVSSRSYVLDWARLSEEEVNDVLSIIQPRDGPRTFSPSGFDETVVTMSLGPQQTDNRMLKYRQFFAEVSNDYLAKASKGEALWKGGFHTVNLGREYFEDELGQPITSYEMIQHVSGIECPVIVGDPNSVLRLGPSAPNNLDLWSTNTANTIAQFLDVIRRIWTSDWYRSPQSLTTLVVKGGARDLLESRSPNAHAVMAVLPFFRQLHAKDSLLANAIDAYAMHCSDTRKLHWISERKNTFVSLVDSVPILPVCAITKTRRDIIRMFMYGAGLLHSSSSHGDDRILAEFIEKHGKHEAVMTLNGCLMDLLRVAVTVYPVVQQDFTYWITQCGVEEPTRFEIGDLFAGYLTSRTEPS